MRCSLAFSEWCYLMLIVIPTLSTHGPVAVSGQPKMRKLRIAVPPKSGFTQFVKITRNNGQLIFDGFAIEVFQQAVNATVDTMTSYQFVPFQRPDGTMNGSYDDMVEAVYNEEYDGAVGDIVIRYSRTRWVDFTIAYTDTGISMMIPMRQKTNSVAKSLSSLTQEMVIGTFVLFFSASSSFWVRTFSNFYSAQEKTIRYGQID